MLRTTIAFGILVALMVGAEASEIERDERVVFFHTCGWFDAETQTWQVPIHGWIFEPEEASRKRAFVRRLFQRKMSLDPAGPERARYKARASAFLVDNEEGKEVQIVLGGRAYKMEESGENGHFFGKLSLSPAEADQLAVPGAGPSRWLSYSALTRPGDQRVFAGHVALVEPEGFSVISDIDDTIKISNVRDQQMLLRNTFLRRFEPVPGMAELYKGWATAGAAFHYVSGSPWQLYVPMAEFHERSGFPRGSFHMRPFRLRDARNREVWSSPDELKRLAVEPLLESYPGRHFICVGDSGERDPEIYGSLARRFPDRIRAVCIRNVSGESADDVRYARAFEGVSRDRWRLFDDPAELAGLIEPPLQRVSSQ
ncbi:MAG: phosphatase domain-containing protein [Pirellulales bacterium]